MADRTCPREQAKVWACRLQSRLVVRVSPLSLFFLCLVNFYRTRMYAFLTVYLMFFPMFLIYFSSVGISYHFLLSFNNDHNISSVCQTRLRHPSRLENTHWNFSWVHWTLHSVNRNWISHGRADVAPITRPLRLGLSALSGTLASCTFGIPIPLHESQLYQRPKRLRLL
jgi:hypothetical protein